jgi:uncharacterized protein (TIGR02646 family)
MRGCRRGPAPDLLAKHGPEIGAAYARRRRDDPTHRFQWPRRDGQSLYAVACDALADMTELHCSYCDGYPLNATGSDEIDHFRPKSREAFYELVCAWDNLFLICGRCNGAKRDRWEPVLLRPDDVDYAFERYFFFRFDSGALEPAPGITEGDHHRALQTIEILELNRTDACIARLAAVKAIRRRSSDDELADVPYRFLIPLIVA